MYLHYVASTDITQVRIYVRTVCLRSTGLVYFSRYVLMHICMYVRMYLVNKLNSMYVCTIHTNVHMLLTSMYEVIANTYIIEVSVCSLGRIAPPGEGGVHDPEPEA